ncbi:MAG: hypothetical protein KBG15_09540 [Kofleriaceae bacterium]|nr:hypothetical protein [Kofleriaceae bacterium]
MTWRLHPRWAIAAAIAVGASCSPDGPLQLQLQLTSGAEQTCPATSCLQIPIQCDAVVSVRIFNPATPLAPYVRICEDLPATENICSLNRLQLPVTNVPNERLEIQVAVFPKSGVPRIDNQPVCPTNLQFSPTGKPTGLGQGAAIAGRAFYSPDDEQTVVDLGCTDLTLVSGAACAGPTDVQVTASVNDFDSGVFLAPALADSIAVAVGEPKAQTNSLTGALEWSMASQFLTALSRTGSAPVPSWAGASPNRFRTSACINVLEDGAQATSTISCRAANASTDTVDIQGYRLSRQSLDQILTTLRLLFFPDEGLVIGMVRDFQGNPASGVMVRASAGTIAYLSADRSAVGGTVTSSSGIFVSRSAPFETTFSANGNVAPVVGGLVLGKVTIVLLELMPPPNQ